MRTDQIDMNILATMQTNARITNHKLAEQVNLSPSACLIRVRRLEAAGYITSYNTAIDLDLITPYVEAFAEITLENHSQEDFVRFDKAVSAIDQITESYKISGTYDYLVKFVCIDVKSYNTLSDHMIESNIGIEKLKTLIILSNTKKFSGYPLMSLLSSSNATT